MKVLVVDDEPALCAMVGGMLRRLGYCSLQAYSAREALDLCAQEIDQIGLVITDVVMPVMNGPTLASRLRELRPDLKVVFMSGYMEEALRKCDNFSVEEVVFLRKPFTSHMLEITIRPLMDSHQATESEPQVQTASNLSTT